MPSPAKSLYLTFSSTVWSLTERQTTVESHTWRHVMSTGMGTLSHFISLLTEPERLIVVGLALITLSILVRRRASR